MGAGASATSLPKSETRIRLEHSEKASEDLKKAVDNAEAKASKQRTEFGKLDSEYREQIKAQKRDIKKEKKEWEVREQVLRQELETAENSARAWRSAAASSAARDLEVSSSCEQDAELWAELRHAQESFLLVRLNRWLLRLPSSSY